MVTPLINKRKINFMPLVLTKIMISVLHVDKRKGDSVPNGLSFRVTLIGDKILKCFSVLSTIVV
jgi:hypothetical protein